MSNTPTISHTIDFKQSQTPPRNFESRPTERVEISLESQASSLILQELLRILNTGDVTPRFQAILDLQTKHILGFEALIRGPSGSPLHGPIKLLQAAATHHLTAPTEHLCRRITLETFCSLGLPGKLFINVSPECLILKDAEFRETLQLAASLGISPNRIVIELTEYQPTHDYDALIDAVMHYRSLGFQIAIDDLGEGFSSLRLWSEIKPDYVKIDMHFIQGIDKDPVKRQFVRSIQEIAKQSSTKVIAEGIETQAELESVAEIGISYGQGYFIARPHATPTTTISAEVIQILGTRIQRGKSEHQFVNSSCITEIMQLPTTVSSKTMSSDVEALFLHHEKLKVIPIVDDGKPIGIINRHTMVDRFARPYQRELYGRKPCTIFMEKDLLLVDYRTDIQKLSQAIVNAESDQLMNGILITREQRYMGMVSGADLLRAITKLQIDAARHANPLTQLPGNVPINQHIDRLLADKRPFTACYCDLDHFKPFNDVYGYQRGDVVIEMTGRLLRQHIEPNLDFVGHIGGDDFVLVFESLDWESRCQKLLAAFQSQIAQFYSHEDRERGGYIAENRQGKKVFHSLISLSIGAVPIQGDFESHHQVSVAMADAKKQAKKCFGNHLFIDRRTGNK